MGQVRDPYRETAVQLVDGNCPWCHAPVIIDPADVSAICECGARYAIAQALRRPEPKVRRIAETPGWLQDTFTVAGRLFVITCAILAFLSYYYVIGTPRHESAGPVPPQPEVLKRLGLPPHAADRDVERVDTNEPETPRAE